MKRRTRPDHRHRVATVHGSVLIALLLLASVGIAAAPAFAAPGPKCAGDTPLRYYPATIVGTDGDDVLRGTSGNDVIKAGGGNDVVFGYGGDDVVCGGTGDDRLSGGAGRDKLFGNTGRDRLVGGASEDDLYGRAGNDVLFGDWAGDHVRGANDDLDGGEGNDYVAGGGGVDYLTGGYRPGMPGDYYLEGGDGNDRLAGGDGNDHLMGGDSYHGGRGDDTVGLEFEGPLRIDLPAHEAGTANGMKRLVQVEGVRGSGYGDVFLGDADDNSFAGGGGSDRVLGRRGHDRLLVDPGSGDSASEVFGGSGNDVITGIYGGVLSGGHGRDSIYVRTRFENRSGRIDGGPGRDLFGFRRTTYSEATVTIDLARGRFVTSTGPRGTINRFENAEGSYGNDTLKGDGGSNTLIGGSGDDVIRGRAGNDRLWGEWGVDTLIGGAGDDDCYDQPAEGNDIDCEEFHPHTGWRSNYAR